MRLKDEDNLGTNPSSLWADANRAGLLNRSGPWKSYPDRMLKMRARGFALRDVFADALGGMISAEEANDYP